MDNAELAYLLGMITGKGTVIRDNNQTNVIIEIPHQSLTIEGMDAKLSVKASLDDIRNILEPLISTRISSLQGEHKTVINFAKNNDDFLIREINRHFQRLSSCKDFRIPQEIFNSASDIKKEFMIGLADVTAHMRSSNLAYGLSYNQRAYIEIPVNWFLVVDIGNLLLDLDVSIHNINWGHPNMRDPRIEDYNSGKQNAWFREHQIKIHADEFEKIGFRIVHKMEALTKLANKNREEWDRSLRLKINSARSELQKEKLKKKIGHIELLHHKYYWQTREIEKLKAVHPMENSEKIPAVIRGKHFDSWKEICKALGYPR
jgi:hypothetical protein